MSLYVKDIYGSVDQQLSGALIPNSTNMNSGNLIQRLPGALSGGSRRRPRGGNMVAAIPPITLLAMQQLYGRKSRPSRRSRRSRFRGKRSRRYRTR
jgi:hypothetical protein